MNALINGAFNFIGGLFGSNRPQYSNYTPEEDNTGTYVAIVAAILMIVFLVLIFRR